MTCPRQIVCCRSHWPRQATRRLRADSTAVPLKLSRDANCAVNAPLSNISGRRRCPVRSRCFRATAIPAGNGNSFSFATVRSTGYVTFRSVTAPSCQTAYEASGPPSLGCPRLPGLTTVRVPSRLTNGKCVWLTRMTSTSTDADSCLHAGESGRQYENNGSDGVASHKNNRWPSRSTDAVSGRSRRKGLSSSGKHLHMCAVWITFYPVARLKRSEAWWAHWARGVVILFAFMLAQRYFR
jgi:hypothetical protein